MSAIPKPLSSKAVKHLVVFNMAIGILRVRKFKDVTAKAVNITDDKRILNKTRKLRAKVEAEMDNIIAMSDTIFSKISYDDLMRIKRGHNAGTISIIPEDSTNPEVLALYLLFVEFQDDIDKRLDAIMQPLLAFDYMELIIQISEEIGLQKDVSDEMYFLALELIKEIKK